MSTSTNTVPVECGDAECPMRGAPFYSRSHTHQQRVTVPKLSAQFGVIDGEPIVAGIYTAVRDTYNAHGLDVAEKLVDRIVAEATYGLAVSADFNAQGMLA